MIEAIARLRKIANEAEDRALETEHDRLVRAEMTDLAVKWQWLAGEAAKLCTKSTTLNEAYASCARCSEKCPIGTSA